MRIHQLNRSRDRKVESQNHENDVGDKHFDTITFRFMNGVLFHCVRIAFRKEILCKVLWRKGQELLEL